ncbi:hypothetical protein [Actinoplanes sp. NPDC026670]
MRYSVSEVVFVPYCSANSTFAGAHGQVWWHALQSQVESSG